MRKLRSLWSHVHDSVNSRDGPIGIGTRTRIGKDDVSRKGTRILIVGLIWHRFLSYFWQYSANRLVCCHRKLE